MYVDVKEYQGIESGPVAILGNGPSLNHWDVTKLDCPTIGINLSSDRIESEYWVTVAMDRAKDVEDGKIKAQYAVITQRDISNECPQPVIKVNMPLPDNYGEYAGHGMSKWTQTANVRTAAEAREHVKSVIESVRNAHFNYNANADGFINIFEYDLTMPMRKTFGGMLAVQAALFLGYDELYLIGMDGGTFHFYPHRRDNIPANYHRACFWHVFDWWRNQNKVRIYQTNPEAIINWFPVKEPPMK